MSSNGMAEATRDMSAVVSERTTASSGNGDACCYMLSTTEQEQLQTQQENLSVTPCKPEVDNGPGGIVDLERIADVSAHGGTCASPAVGSPITKNRPTQRDLFSTKLGGAARNLAMGNEGQNNAVASEQHDPLPLPARTFDRMILALADCFSSTPPEGQKKILKSFALVHFDCPDPSDDLLGMCFRSFDQETQKKVLHAFFSVYANEGQPWTANGQPLSPADVLRHFITDLATRRGSVDSTNTAIDSCERASTLAPRAPWSPATAVGSARLSISAPHMFHPGVAGWHVPGAERRYSNSPASGTLPRNSHAPPSGRPLVAIVPPKPLPIGRARTRYSRKVFVGGTPWDVVEDSLIVAFSPFGSAHVEWPKDRPGVAHRRGTGASTAGDAKTGYVYVLFELEQAVERLVHTCSPDHSGRMWLDLELTRENGIRSRRNVEIIPWVQNDAHWCVAGHADSVCGEPDSRKTVFVGGLHGRISAYMLAHAMDQLFGCVVASVIDLDRHKYPIGSGRVIFSSERAQRAAIGAQFVYVSDHALRDLATFSKTIQVEQYLSPQSPCSVCHSNSPTVVFCRHPGCAEYLCDSHWRERHACMSDEERASHRKVQRRSAHGNRLAASSGDWAVWQHNSAPPTANFLPPAARSFDLAHSPAPSTTTTNLLNELLCSAAKMAAAGVGCGGPLPPSCPPPSPAVPPMGHAPPPCDWALPPLAQRCGRPQQMTNTGRGGFGPNAPVSYF